MGADVHLYGVRDETAEGPGVTRPLRLSSRPAATGTAWHMMRTLYAAGREELPPDARVAWDAALMPLLGPGEPGRALDGEEVEALRWHASSALASHRGALLDALAAQLRGGPGWFRDAADAMRFVEDLHRALVELAERGQGLLVATEPLPRSPSTSGSR